MKIKRFFGQDIRKVIRLVREELGADAVILSNRQVQGGIEIVAAIDYDESLFAPGAEAQSAPGAEAQIAPPKAVTAGATDARVQTAADRARTGHPTTPEQTPAPHILWSQEPALVEMRHELASLTGMVANQLSGLAWGELGRRHPMRVRLLRDLAVMGFSPALCREIADAAVETSDYATLRRTAMGVLAQRLPVTNDDILSEGGVVALLGPTGVGKTTTVAKLAARCILRYGPASVALLTTDSYRIGAHEQLRVYGKILGVPVRTASDGQELSNTLDGLRGRRLVLIDTAGMSQRDLRLREQFALFENRSSVKSYLVLSATTQMHALDQAVRAFGHKPLSGCVLTKVDEATSLGGVLSVVIQHQLPVAYITDGQRVPEDIRQARPHSLVNRSAEIVKETDQALTDEWLAHTFGDLMVNANR